MFMLHALVFQIVASSVVTIMHFELLAARSTSSLKSV